MLPRSLTLAKVKMGQSLDGGKVTMAPGLTGFLDSLGFGKLPTFPPLTSKLASLHLSYLLLEWSYLSLIHELTPQSFGPVLKSVMSAHYLVWWEAHSEV